MQLALDPECPVFDRSNKLHLLNLLVSVSKGWHNLVNPDASMLREAIGEELWEIFGIALERSVKSRIYSQRSVERPEDCKHCNPARLSQFLASEVVLLVENAHTDGGFLLAVARRLRPAMRGSLEGSSASVRILQAGGIGEIPKEIQRHTAPGHWYMVSGLPPRFVVLADSDGRFPGEISSAARAVIAAAGEAGVDVHILMKRSIENYVPGEALGEYARSRRHASQAVEVITALGQEAWDHYSVKHGLPAGPLHPKESTLYGAEVPRGQGMGDFMADFLQDFEHVLVADDIQRRDHSGDLHALLDMIERNL